MYNERVYKQINCSKCYNLIKYEYLYEIVFMPLTVIGANYCMIQETHTHVNRNHTFWRQPDIYTCEICGNNNDMSIQERHAIDNGRSYYKQISL